MGKMTSVLGYRLLPSPSYRQILFNWTLSMQKLAFKMILQKDYITYQQACKHFSALSLAERRDKLSLQFAKTNLKSENNLFTKLTNNVNTRNTHNIVKEPFCNTTRYKKSSIPYLARILNQMGNK